MRYTRVAELSVVESKPKVTKQPDSIAVLAGKTATFEVTAVGGGMSYQWYYRTSEIDERTAIDEPEGKAAEYQITADASLDGREYRCTVTNLVGSVDSEIVTLRVLNEPTITGQPENAAVSAGGIASFTVAAQGEELSCQWYFRRFEETEWTAVAESAGGKTAELSFKADAEQNGWQYYRRISNPVGSVDSCTATLTVE